MVKSETCPSEKASGVAVSLDSKQSEMRARDFVHVQDVVEANMLALKNKGVVGEVFNVATGVATTINQLANVLFRTANKTHLKMVHSETRKGDIKHSVADISKAKGKLHYDPKVLLKDGLKKLTIS